MYRFPRMQVFCMDVQTDMGAPRQTPEHRHTDARRSMRVCWSVHIVLEMHASARSQHTFQTQLHRHLYVSPCVCMRTDEYVCHRSTHTDVHAQTCTVLMQMERFCYSAT